MLKLDNASVGSYVTFESIDSLRRILLDNGWTYLTALSAIIPTVIVFVVCFITTIIFPSNYFTVFFNSYIIYYTFVII